MKTLERILLYGLLAAAVVEHLRLPSAAGDSRAYAGSEFTLQSDQGKTLATFRISAAGTPELVMVDRDGRGRLVLAVKGNDDAMIALTDAKGSARAALTSGPDDTYDVRLAEASGFPRLLASLDAKGACRFAVLDPKGKEQGALGLTAAGAPVLYLTTATADTRMALDQHDWGLTFGFLDKGNEPRVGMSYETSGSTARVFAQDSSGKQKAEMVAAGDGPATIGTHDKSGKRTQLK